MYRIKRFSVLYDKLFSNKLSECRKLAKGKEDVLISHLLVYLLSDDDNENINHWLNEIPLLISDKIGLKRKEARPFRYKECFPGVFSGTLSLPVRSSIEGKLRKEISNNLVRNKLISKYLDNLDNLYPIIEYLCNKLDKLKDSLNRTPTTDRSDKLKVIDVLIDLKNKHRIYL